MTAEHLLRGDGIGEALIGQHGFDDRRQQTHVIISSLTLLLIVGPMGEIALQRGPHHQRTRRFVEGADRHQCPANIGMNDNRIGGLVFGLRSGQCAALQTVPRI